MVTFVTVNAEVSADDVLNAIIDKCLYKDEIETLQNHIGKHNNVTIDVKIDQEDAICDLSDDYVMQEYRKRNGGAEIEIEHEFIDAIRALRDGDMDIARGLFGRMFQSYPAFQARVDEAVR